MQRNKTAPGFRTALHSERSQCQNERPNCSRSAIWRASRAKLHWGCSSGAIFATNCVLNAPQYESFADRVLIAENVLQFESREPTNHRLGGRGVSRLGKDADLCFRTAVHSERSRAKVSAKTAAGAQSGALRAPNCTGAAVWALTLALTAF